MHTFFFLIQQHLLTAKDVQLIIEQLKSCSIYATLKVYSRQISTEIHKTFLSICQNPSVNAGQIGKTLLDSRTNFHLEYLLSNGTFKDHKTDEHSFGRHLMKKSSAAPKETATSKLFETFRRTRPKLLELPQDFQQVILKFFQEFLQEFHQEFLYKIPAEISEEFYPNVFTRHSCRDLYAFLQVFSRGFPSTDFTENDLRNFLVTVRF